MRTGKPRDRDDLNIMKGDWVLEVGSGHNPSYRSNVLVERFLDDNHHRCGDVKIYPHQTMVHADGEDMPFQDKEFDYVICNQVLEHAEHPEKFIREITRVAKRGYIETPSLLGEFLFPKETHKWVILDIDDKLVLFEKAKMPGNYFNNYGELFLNYLPYQSLPFKLLGFTEGDVMFTRYEWKESIDFIVNPEDPYYSSFFLKKWNREMVTRLFPPRSFKDELIHTISAGFYLIKEKIQNKMNHRSPMELSEYMELYKDKCKDLWAELEQKE